MYGIFKATGDGYTFCCSDILLRNENDEFCVFFDEYEALEYMEEHGLKLFDPYIIHNNDDDDYTIEELRILE